MPSFKPVVAAGVFIPLVGAAIWLIYGQLIVAGALEPLFKPLECPIPPVYLSQSQQRYTGISALDQRLCVGVEFTKLSLSGRVQPLMVYLLSCVSPVFLTLCIEGLRADGPGQWFSTLGLLISAAAAGIAIPAAWLFMFAIFKRESKRPLSRPAAEAAFIAHVFGYLVPYCLMVVTMHEYSMVLWMLFVYWIPSIQKLWLSVRPHTPESGFWVAQLALGTTFLVASAVHLTMAVSYAPQTTWNDFVQWLPAATTSNSKTLTLEGTMLQLIQWDWVFAVVAPVIAGFFYVDSASELLGFAMIVPMLLPLAGPGAAVALIWMWREWKLTMLEETEQQERRQVKEQKQE